MDGQRPDKDGMTENMLNNNYTEMLLEPSGKQTKNGLWETVLGETS